MSYIGYFKNTFTDELYSVLIKKENDNSEPIEIYLAGHEPFIIDYNTSNYLYSSFRNSVASINIIHNSYLTDVLSNKPRETHVILKNETQDKILWVGYLTSKIYSMPYENCIEQYTLEASDVISSMQYFEYESENKDIITLKQLIVNLLNDTQINYFYWPKTKYVDNNLLKLEDLRISEMNFFSSDTEEGWSHQEILDELCKYFCLTAIQEEDKLYFMDNTQNDVYQYSTYAREADWNETNSIFSGKYVVLTENMIMGNGEQISTEPIYNKIVVKDNFYTAEELIPNIFDDAYLTNRDGEGNFNSSFEVFPLPNTASYPDGTSWFHQKYVKDADDNKYRYFHRLYDNKEWESIYRNNNLQQVFPNILNNSDITRFYQGGTIVELGRVEKDYFDTDTYQNIIANSINWERYLCMAQNGFGYQPSNGDNIDNLIAYKFKTRKGRVMLSQDAYLVLNFSIIPEKYKNRNYINPDWTTKAFDQSSWESGESYQTPCILPMILRIGDKYWNGKSWTTKREIFAPPMTRDESDGNAYINESKQVLNNVSWELGIDAEGYKIPLKGIDTTQEIEFALSLPKIQLYTDFDGINPTEYNGYCWIKDLSIKVAHTNETLIENENDVVYENIIDEENVNEINDITLKFTTHVKGIKPSYSNVIYKDNFLNIIGDFKAEEHIINNYYLQYSTPSKKFNYTINLEGGQKDIYSNIDVDNIDKKYLIIGSQIDYSYNKQTITLIEKK